ncbi:DUF547 domain-containing protein [Winogradskyella jejuensis]|uniref:DUF547 domain-containing protein n=1 Tax=Winogradskyella jejuensis TaxID=1089305 RepID=A0A1M5LH73_9FLAO|nr:DUF547 domain-containing protein [Winogradskyella jejuensis]SHG64387.1 Protein of unknown function, DUF547 [Winogradskyella jejuensis]
MKNRYLTFLLCFLLAACGSSKKAIEKTEETKKVENEIEIKKDIDYVIKEDIAVENIDPRVVQEDSKISTERKVDSVYMIDGHFKPKNKPDLGFHQDLTKTTYDSLDDFWSSILKRNVSDYGNVDYNSFKKDYKGLLYYIKFLQDSIPSEDASKNEKLAYWINAYNALTIDLILRNYPVKSIKDIKDPWDQRLWKFGDKWMNLNQIEHEILRKMDEPRIHFAIVCASFSCPKLQNKAFTASNLESQLTNATKEFLADKNRNIISADKLQLSKIFKWFPKDFKTDGSLINFLNKYSEVEISSNAKKSFLDYNWDLND